MVKKIDKKSEKKEYTLDIFRILDAVDRKQLEFYDNLKEEEKKSIAFVPLIRWLSCVISSEVYSEYYLQMTNAIINIGEPTFSSTRRAGDKNNGFMAFRNHPELMWKLMTVIGSGRKQRHLYIKTMSESKTVKLDELLLKKYSNINNDELKLLKTIYTKDDIIELSKNYGYNDKEINEILKEVNN